MTDDARQRWQQRYDAALAAGRVRDADFTTLSGVEVHPVYGPADESSVPGFERVGYPGEFPFHRGLHATGYRGRAWTIRQFAGFGNAQQTNERYKMILAEGGGGLSVAFDMPTLMGRDSDDPRALGEVGHCGVAVDSAADMDILFDGIDLATTTTSMTISGPAVPVFCMYVVAAERQGADTSRLNGTLQTDIFKEYIAQKEWIYPPEPHLKLIGDLMEYVDEHIPAYKPLSVSGYHIREAGSTAAQELAFTLADGFGYVELGLSRGLDIDAFAPGLAFFFDAHEEIFAKIRDMSEDGSMTSGILRGIEDGWFMAEIADASFTYQQQLEKREKKVVGVNVHTQTAEQPIEILRISHQVERDQAAALAHRRADRDDAGARAAIAALREAARGHGHLIPPMLA